MPLLDIEIVGEPDAVGGATLAQRIADAAGAVLGATPQTTWVRVKVLPPETYAENGGTPVGVQPVFVKVIKRVNPQGAALDGEIHDLTVAIAGACHRPVENVHICYEMAGAGRQAFGGKLV